MSYNNDLQNNNTELRSILAMAESLPEAGANDAVRYGESQSLTEEQKAQARANIGAEAGGSVAEHNRDKNAHEDIREELSNKLDASAIVQNTGDSTEKVMSQSAVTAVLEALTTLPYGGSKEWLEDNGDRAQLYQIDGYVWAYIDSTGWTRSGGQFLIVSSESEMTNEGGTEYLLRNGNSGTVYDYTEASGDSDVPVVDSIPETANDGDVITIKPTEVSSTAEMTDTSKQYALDGKVYAYGEVYDTVNEQIFDASKVFTGHMSGVNIRSSSNKIYPLPVDVSQIPDGVVAYVEINGFYIRNTTSPSIEKIGWSAFESPAVGDSQLIFCTYGNPQTGADYFNSEELFATTNGVKIKVGYKQGDKFDAYDTIKTLLLEIKSGTTYDASKITAYLQYSGNVTKWYDTGLSVGRKYEASVSGADVTWTDVGTYVEPTEASWDATAVTYDIIDSLHAAGEHRDSAVYSGDGYVYTYMTGSAWMQTSKYSAPTLSIDGELSLTSKNAIQNKVVAVAIDALDAKTKSNTSEINAINEKIANIEVGSDTVTIPSFWQSAVDACIAKIKALQVGRNCVTFPFFSDNHQRNGYAGILISHIMKECNIPYCFFGGDSISNGIIADEATMIAQDKAFDTAMSYIPNGRFCRAVGNHDGFWNDGTNKYWYNRDQIYDLFLREESIAQNKHFGGEGTYYYIDDIASKVRWIVMDTNNAPVDDAQITWVQNTALSFGESGWEVVFISHQPISNHYHAGITNAVAVVSAIVSTANTKNVPIVGWFSGHVHRDIISTKRLTGGNGSNAGTEAGDLGFTQVIITSDHTGIAYDDATKHTVANDDQSHAIDFVTINKATRTVNITRLGIGNDRSYMY